VRCGGEASWGHDRPGCRLVTFEEALAYLDEPVAVDDVLSRWPVAHRWRATSPDGRGIGHRRVKVRWVTPLGDETASMS